MKAIKVGDLIKFNIAYEDSDDDEYYSTYHWICIEELIGLVSRDKKGIYANIVNENGTLGDRKYYIIDGKIEGELDNLKMLKKYYCSTMTLKDIFNESETKLKTYRDFSEIKKVPYKRLYSRETKFNCITNPPLKNHDILIWEKEQGSGVVAYKMIAGYGSYLNGEFINKRKNQKIEITENHFWSSEQKQIFLDGRVFVEKKDYIP